MTRLDIPIDLFKCGIVFYCGDRHAMRRTLAADGLLVSDSDFGDIGSSVGAVLDIVDEPDKILWLAALDLPVLVHEAVHAAKRILDEKGVSDEETLCYLVEHIVRVIFSSRFASRLSLSSDATSHKTAKQSARSLHRARF